MMKRNDETRRRPCRRSHKGLARLTEWGSIALRGSPADFGRFIADETEKWSRVIRAANIKPE